MISENATCAWSRPWTGSNFFLRIWIELRFCINLAMHMVFDGKLLLSKTNCSIQSIFNFRDKIVHIVHGKRPFNFARCAIVLLFELNGNPSLRVTSGGDSRQRSEFADFGALAHWKTWFFIKFHENSRLLARNGAQNRKLASLTRIAPQK